MGSVYDTIPPSLAIELRDRFGLRYFVETGTWSGKTASWAAQYFERVWTIELNDHHYGQAQSLFGHMEKITFIHGDSRIWLTPTLGQLEGPALFYLDAHWGPDLGYKRPDAGECPLLDELAQIRAHYSSWEHVVVIDDAGMFRYGVGDPHLAEQWPTWDEVCAALSDRRFYIKDGVIVGEPL